MSNHLEWKGSQISQGKPIIADPMSLGQLGAVYMVPLTRDSMKCDVF
jgi:hypothetical protein